MAIIICAIYLILLAIIMFILKLVFFKILSNTKLLIFFIVMIAIPFSLYKGCQSCVRKIKNEFLQESTPVSFVSDNEGKEVRLSFDCGDNINMNEIVSMFKTFAYALGYNEVAINSHLNSEIPKYPVNVKCGIKE